MSLSNIVADYLQGKIDPEKNKIYITQHKARPYKQTVTSSTNQKILQARCDLPPQTIPEKAIALTAGIDVQKLGFWFAARAWARDFTSWLIHYGFLAAWADVENLLFNTRYPMANDPKITKSIWRAAIDTGGGKKYEDMSMTEETYWWIRKHGIGRGCGVYATKGSSRPLAGKCHAGKPLDKTPSGKSLPGGLQIISIDTDKAKDMVYYRLFQASKQGAYSAYLHKVKILKGVERISTFGQFSRALFPDLVKLGLPVIFWKNSWWGHADKIESFFRELTMVKADQKKTREEIMEAVDDEKFSAYDE